VEPDADDDKDSQGDVKIFERLIKGVTKDRVRLESHGDESDNYLVFVSLLLTNAGGVLTITPHNSIRELSIDFATAAKPPVLYTEAPHDKTWAIASRTTILPCHLCNKLKVSNDKLSQLMRGLFLDAMINKGI
jgi:hypothetical protein